MEIHALDDDIKTHRNSRRWLLRALELFSITGLINLGLRPVLTTVVVADDLIGPFSMFNDAGPSLWSHVKAGYNAASYGHFNYIGQIVGAFVNWIWLRLMLAGVRYSTLYFFTKLIIYIALIYVAAATIRSILAMWNTTIHPVALRIAIAITMIGTLQLHLVWSNDPVASYPMSGYTSVIFGLLAIWAAAELIQHSSTWIFKFVAPLTFLTAVLYYEMNIALIPTIGILAISYHVSHRSTQISSIKHLARIAAIYVVPTIFIAILQMQNAAKSASYEGTAIALNDGTLTTFVTLLISSLPFSSWHLGFDWLYEYPSTLSSSMLLLGTASLISIGLWRIHEIEKTKKVSQKAFWLIPPLVSYWIFSTAIQSATSKVQSEATRIGSVYNFYAVGSTVLILLIAVSVLFTLQKIEKIGLKIIFLTPFFIVINLQVFLNFSIQQQHYTLLPQVRHLLVSYSERRPIDERCLALQTWLSMGWPTYYSNSMTTGMEKSYQTKFNEPFCGRL